MILLLRSLSFK